MLVGQIVFGAAVYAILLVNFLAVPIGSMLGSAGQASAYPVGWDEAVVRIEAAAAEYDTDFLAGTGYFIASDIAWRLPGADVVSLSGGTDQFDFWFDPAHYRGRDAILVADNLHGLRPYARSSFASVEEIEHIAVERFGFRVNDIRLYLARGFGAGARDVGAD
jgi:hypothetical protein